MKRSFVGVVILGLWTMGCGVFGGKDKPDPGTEGAACASGQVCNLGLACIVGVCKPPGSQQANAVCTASRDCAGSLYCSPAGRCLPAGTAMVGANCASDAICQGGLRCAYSGFTGTCVQSGTVEQGGACTTQNDCLAGLFCGGANSNTCLPYVMAFPPFRGEECADEGVFRAYFEVPRAGTPPKDFFRLPFPSDVRVSSAGALDIADFPRPGGSPLGVDLVTLYADAWVRDFDGFGPTASATMRFSKAVNFDSLGDNVQVVDLTTGMNLGYGYAASTGGNKYLCANPLYIGPGDANWPHGHVIATLVMNGVRSTAGESPVQDPDLAAVLGANAPTDAALMRAWDAHAALRTWLTSKNLTTDKVAAVAVFTVGNPTAVMERVAEVARTRAAPLISDLTLCDTGVTSPCADGTPQRACGAAHADFHELHGKLAVPIFQEGTQPYEKPEHGGGIPGAGVPPVVRTENVCFALTVPKSAAPMAGFPLVVYHHGTGGSLRSFIGDGLPTTLSTASRPMAVVGFDAVAHGARKAGSMISTEQLVFNALNPRSARDNFLQGAADIITFMRLAEVTVPMGSSPTGAELKFDRAAVAFFGHSQGATSGVLALPFTDAAPAAILSGAGAFLSASLMDKSSPVNAARGMELLIGDKLSVGHPVMSLLQSFFERSDPINYGGLVVRTPPMGRAAKHVYMSYGPNDTYSPPSTMRHQAVSLGLPTAMTVIEPLMGSPTISRPVRANLRGGDNRMVTAAVFQYAPPVGKDGHFVALDVAAARMDWLSFLQSWMVNGPSGAPEIP